MKINNIDKILRGLCKISGAKSPLDIPGKNVRINFSREDGDCQIFATILQISTLKRYNKEDVQIDISGFVQFKNPMYLLYSASKSSWVLMKNNKELDVVKISFFSL